MKRSDIARQVSLATLATLAALAACSGGSSSAVNANTSDGDFRLVRTDPVNGQSVYLNDPLRMDFSEPVDLDSATLTTVSFQAIDALGNPVTDLVTGRFLRERSAGDAEVGRRLLFVPTFATNNAFDNGGFRAGRSYSVQLVGGTTSTTVLRSTTGRKLETPATFQFTTREGTQPAQIFRNPRPGGPRRADFAVSTATDLNNVPLGLFGAPPTEIRLGFDQALNPDSQNLPVGVDSNPLTRSEANKGRIYLEYKDPVLDPLPDEHTWIPADVEIERNDLTGATLVLRPLGVLPNNAEIRVIVESTVEDISGESNSAEPSYNPVFASFRTTASYAQQWNAIVEGFDALGQIDLSAAFPESQAEVGPGFVKASFAFEGKSTTLEYAPTSTEVVLNTAFTQIAPSNGLAVSVAGGVFNFRNVTIPQGVTVIGQGPNPMVWLCSGRFTVSGTLTVRGGDGQRVNVLNSANLAKAGGVAGPAGGNGGDGTPSATLRDTRGGTGRGPLQVSGRGGRGGYRACVSGCYTGNGYNGSGGGSGGGGGTMATQGDPSYRGTTPTNINPNTPSPPASTSFQQVRGFGGAGCSGDSGTRSGFLNGGEPGDRVFTDTRLDNNFWGTGINLAGPNGRTLRITGELSVPVGGSGGGGGGDTSNSFDCSLSGNQPVLDYSGGGGGGGGGVLIVKALEEITITSTGLIDANGGLGGGGEQAGSCGEAGGGGGGAGGMVVLMSAKALIIEAHGSTAVNPPRFLYGAPDVGAVYQGNDYSFAISADGGVCRTGNFGSVNVASKYPAAGTPPRAGALYGRDPLGGFGGMGVVQLMVPPGTAATSDDNTNTILDDNIIFRLPNTTTRIDGVAKQQLLAWRGFPNNSGDFVNDAGNPINIDKNEGDIRPSPILLPCPFSGRSRARSQWIDTGASKRRPLAAADGLPRGIVAGGATVVGPKYEFAGVAKTGPLAGYVDYVPLGNTGVRINYPTIVTPRPIATLTAGSDVLGEPAYRLTTATPEFGDANRYVQYEAELLNGAGAVLASFPILAHTSTELLLKAGTELLPTAATQVQIRAKFFKIVTSSAEGLGPVYLPGGSGTPSPIANVRIGFAFHQNPNPTNILNGRFPSDSENNFISNLEDPAFLAWVNANGAPRYVQWDLLFDMAFKPTLSQPPSLTPTTPRPELRFLRLPFRF
ncbi:MAG: Ig-like domain-containing protein [Planctomycetota bacterium]